jgi:signal peptidase II
LPRFCGQNKNSGKGWALSASFFMKVREQVLPLIVLLLAAVAVAADQALKMTAVAYLEPVGDISVIPGFFHLTYVRNPGAAFGILADQRWIFMILSVVLCAAIVVLLFRYRGHTRLSYWGSALVLAGGVGNMIDRFRNGYVVDYLHVLFFPFIFNFADACVTVGTVLLLIHILLLEKRGRKHGKYRKYAKYANRNYRNW